MPKDNLSNFLGSIEDLAGRGFLLLGIISHGNDAGGDYIIVSSPKSELKFKIYATTV